LRPCLFSDNELDLRSVLRNGSDEDVRTVLSRALHTKPEEHEETVHANETVTNMNAIGG
jgi:cyclic pyranopterin phosphate synthase